MRKSLKNEFLGAWLKKACGVEMNRDEHRNHFFINSLLPDDRELARAEIMRLLGGVELAAYERPGRVGEPEQPFECA